MTANQIEFQCHRCLLSASIARSGYDKEDFICSICQFSEICIKVGKFTHENFTFHTKKPHIKFSDLCEDYSSDLKKMEKYSEI